MASDPNGLAYYSDYFVFIADDGGAPLVIPMDANWRPTETGFSTELKAWHGTRDAWPIRYEQDTHGLSGGKIPTEIWQLPSVAGFVFNEREISLTVAGAPSLRIALPKQSDWVSAPNADDNQGLFVAKTVVVVEGQTRRGFLLYERIRRQPNQSGGGGDGPGFRRFHWMPLVIDGALYHFKDNSGSQSALRWIERNSSLVAEQGGPFTFEVQKNESDSQSGRAEVPQVLRIRYAPWSVDVVVESSGHQTGYGPQRDSGLALYRQSLLESTSGSPEQAVGMLELILDD
jgi:hypothetical protein